MAVAGTHEEAMSLTASGSPRAASTMKRMPGSPATLAISCGSLTTQVTPRGSTAAANWDGMQRLDSMCTCASISAGAR